jgi:hypothetical protein
LPDPYDTGITPVVFKKVADSTGGIERYHISNGSRYENTLSVNAKSSETLGVPSF